MYDLLRTFRYKIKKKFHPKVTADATNLARLEHLETNFFSWLDFLNKNVLFIRGKKRYLNQLPWHLLIGGAGAGKSTLLANANINYVKRAFSGEIGHWWLSAHHAIFDLHDVDNDFLIDQFLLLSQQFKKTPAFKNVLIALSLSELMDREDHPRLINQFASQLNRIKQKFGASIPVQFVLTKCDLLPGFMDFFGDFCAEELAQPWGVQFPYLTSANNCADMFMDRFNLLIKRLNNQLIYRLHQERNTFSKSAIKDFPLYLEQVKEAFLLILNPLLAKTEGMYFQGIHLTSAMQHTSKELKQIHSRKNQVSEEHRGLALIETPVMPNQAYFVKQLLLHVLRTETKNII